MTSENSATKNNRVSLVERIQDAQDIVEYASKFGSFKDPAAAGGDFKGKCILPGHTDKTPSFRVNREKGVFKCMGCGRGGNVVHLYAELNNLDFESAKIEFAKELGIFREKSAVREVGPISRTQGRYARNLEGHRNALKYLTEDRKLTAETIERYGIGYCWGNEHERSSEAEKSELVRLGVLREAQPEGAKPDQQARDARDWMAGRITFPIKDASGQIVAFAGRLTWYEKGVTRAPKYLNSPETALFKKSSMLYGLYDATSDIRRRKYATVVEGYMDVIGLGQLQVNNAVAVMGAQATSSAFEHLWAITKRIVFCLDGDAAGENGALRSVMAAAPTMPNDGVIAIARLPEGMDPDEYAIAHGAQAFEDEICGKAQPLSVVLVENELKNRDLGTVEGRASFLTRIEKLAEQFEKAPVIQDQLMREAKARCSASVIRSAMSSEGVGDLSLLELKNAYTMLREAMLKKADSEPDEAIRLGFRKKGQEAPQQDQSAPPADAIGSAQPKQDERREPRRPRP